MATRAWRDRVKFTTSTTGTGTITQGSAASGFQLFAPGDDGKQFTFAIEDGTAWEVSKGTYTHIGTTLSRTLIASSTGSLLSLNAGATVFVDWTAEAATASTLAMQAITPGGRLTLTSGTPVTTSDVAGATNIYYTPYIHNIINLWDGAAWIPIEFSEYTLALGTITSGKPYDVFAYLNAGVLALEILVWTSDTARATAVTIQDGRYCKSGDKTRLLLGTFYTTATTTTEDSVTKRFLCNWYNTANKKLEKSTGADSHTYGSTTWRSWNSSTTHRVQWVVCIVKDTFLGQIEAVQIAASGFNRLGFTLNGTGYPNFQSLWNTATPSLIRVTGIMLPALGLNYGQLTESSDSGNLTNDYGTILAMVYV